MKKIMILGASILQLPAIIKAKELGLQTIVVDMDRYAIGLKEANVFLELSTIDAIKIVEAAKKYGVDGIMTIASDMPMRSVAAVAKELNIVGVSEDTALKTTNKALMRKCLQEHGVPIPAYSKVNNFKSYLAAIQQFTSKFIVKPIDNSGSRGVFMVKDISDIESINYAYEYSAKHSRCGEIVVEEYMEGPEVSVETLSVDGDVHIIAITDKLTTGAPWFVEMGHSQPSRLSKDIKEKLKEVTIAAVKALGIKDGPSHTEIIVTEAGPKIVELGARLGGDNITTHLVPLSTGVDIVKCCIEISMGYKPNLGRKFNMGSAIRYFKTSTGRIANIRGVEEADQLDGIKQISFVKNIGDIIGEIHCSSDRIGFVIAQGKNAEEAIAICEEALDRIIIETVEI